jgi:hypothetical protein
VCGSRCQRRSRQEKNWGFGGSEAPDSGQFRLLGRLQAVWRMKLPATLTRRVPAEFRGERDSNEAPITVKSLTP